MEKKWENSVGKNRDKKVLTHGRKSHDPLDGRT